MPNTVPNILTVESLKEKYAIASKKSQLTIRSSWG
jgi:dihydroorotase